jgi:hypothetical protein
MQARRATRENDRRALLNHSGLFWDTFGIVLPDQETVDAYLQAAVLHPAGPGQQPRRVVLVAMADAGTLNTTAAIFISNLAQLEFDPADGGQRSNLARHLIMISLGDSLHQCRETFGALGVRCIPDPVAGRPGNLFSDHEARKNTTNAAYLAAAWQRITGVLNALTLGLDVLFLDCDQVCL